MTVKNSLEIKCLNKMYLVDGNAFLYLMAVQLY